MSRAGHGPLAVVAVLVGFVAAGCGAMAPASPPVWDGATGQLMKPLTEQQRQLAHSAAAADGDEPLPEEAEDGTPLRPGQVTMVLENLRDPDGPIVGVPIVNRCHTSPAYGGYTTRFYNVQAPFVVMVERPPRGSDYCDSVGLDGEFAHGTRVTVYDETGEVLERWQTTRAPDSVTRPSVTARFW